LKWPEKRPNRPCAEVVRRFEPPAARSAAQVARCHVDRRRWPNSSPARALVRSWAPGHPSLSTSQLIRPRSASCRRGARTPQRRAGRARGGFRRSKRRPHHCHARHGGLLPGRADACAAPLSRGGRSARRHHAASPSAPDRARPRNGRPNANLRPLGQGRVSPGSGRRPSRPGGHRRRLPSTRADHAHSASTRGGLPPGLCHTRRCAHPAARRRRAP